MREYRKGILIATLLLVMCCALSACDGKGRNTGKPIQEVSTLCETKNVQTYTIDGEGNLIYFDMPIEPDTELLLIKKDREGNEVFSRPFDVNTFCNLSAMAVEGDTLYFAADGIVGNDVCAFLYAYQMNTGESIFLQSFRYFKHVDRILVNADRIYLLGRNSVSGPGGRSNRYAYRGEKVMWIPRGIEQPEVYELDIADPIDMALEEDGTPVFYVHDTDGFSLLRYQEKTDTVKTIAKMAEYRMNSFAVCNQGNSILYYTERGLVLSEISELEVESELYPKTTFWDKGLCYVNGTVACRTQKGELVRFPLSEVEKKAKTIRFLSVGYEIETPYGCGYRIERENFSEGEMNRFALKVLAQDKDYDMCMVDSSDPISYNLKENGVFYPLNDVPGIEEYLEACFPYVREAAVNQDGQIWMLPIQVNIPGFVMDTDTASAYGFRENMTYREYFLAQSTIPEEMRKQIGTPWVALIRFFFSQYFRGNDTVNTDTFRDTMLLFSEYLDYIKPYSMGGDETQAVYQCVTDAMRYRILSLSDAFDSSVVYSWPKVSEEDGNVGTCLFLAVNPESGRLQETLQYLEDWIAFTMQQPDQPLFFEDRSVGTSAYEASLFGLYQGGAIAFAPDAEITDGYEEVLSDSTAIDRYISETERKLKVYLNE